MTNYAYLYIIRFLDYPYYYKGSRLCPKGVLPHEDNYFGSPYTHKDKWELKKEKAIIIIISGDCREEVFREINILESTYITKEDLKSNFCLNEAKTNGKFIEYGLEACKKGGQNTHRRDENGIDLFNKKLHERFLDENGKSLLGLNATKKIHELKTSDGRSVHTLHAKKWVT